MMSFEYPQILFLIPILMVLLGIGGVYEWKRKKPFLDAFRFPAGRSASLLSLRLVLAAFAASLLIVALSRPFVPMPVASRSFENVYVMAVFDVSWSMSAKNEEGTDRLSRAKTIAFRLLTPLEGAHIQLAGFTDRFGTFTDWDSDFSHALSAAQTIVQIESIMGSGTDLNKAFVRAFQSFPDKDTVQKILILFSDGGTPSPFEMQEIAKTLGYFRQEKIQIIVVGVGEKEGVLLEQELGKSIVSALNEDILSSIAEMGGGKYFYELSVPKNPISFWDDIISPSFIEKQGRQDITKLFVGLALAPLWFLWWKFRL